MSQAEEPAERIKVVQPILFYTAKATLREESASALKVIVKALSERPKISLRIEVHTDSRGSAKYNAELTQKRADSIRDALVAKGVDRARLFPIGRGEIYPVADNRTRQGRAANRRVEFLVIQQGSLKTLTAP